ncbi:MAG: hypothetical protein H6854_02500 [Rhodospirillales bacterium]|nr:hypothetical protein [Rhodospirillales bacterium]
MITGLFLVPVAVVVGLYEMAWYSFNQLASYVACVVMFGLFFLKGRRLYKRGNPLRKEIVKGLIFIVLLYGFLLIYSLFFEQQSIF